MSNSSSKFSSVVLGLACAAPLAVGLLSALLGLGLPPLVRWFWPTPTTSVAEAAALGDAARVRVLAAGGARLYTPMPVPPGYVDDGTPMMSALEAAVLRRSDSLVAVILDLDGRPPAQEAQRLYCLSTEIKADDVTKLLGEAFALSPSACTDAPSAHGNGS